MSRLCGCRDHRGDVAVNRGQGGMPTAGCLAVCVRSFCSSCPSRGPEYSLRIPVSVDLLHDRYQVDRGRSPRLAAGSTPRHVISQRDQLERN
jgi:hypothetical protein